jgi:hypothetical protein
MPLPALPVVMTIGRAIIAGGTRRAAKKYGDDVVKQVQKSDAFKELKGKTIESRKLSAKSSKNNKRFKSQNNQVQENAVKRQKAEERILDLDNSPIEEIPLRFDMKAGGLLSDERAMYSGEFPDLNKDGKTTYADVLMGRGVREKKAIGGLVTKLFKLAKKKEPKKVKEQDIDKVLNSLSEEQMDKLSPIEIEQLLDMDLAKSGVDNIPAKSTKKDIDDVLGGLTDKEMENLSDIEIEQLLDMDLEKYGRKGKMNGGLLSDDRQTYGMGSIVKKLLKKKPSKQARDINYAEKEIDGLIDLRKKREAQLELDLEDATKGEQSDLLEQYNDDWNLITQKINVYQDQLRKLGVKPTAKNMIEKSRTSKAEGGMMPDEDMEEGYTRFIMDEALTEEEEDMLTSKLEQDEELQMLFDKVIDVAQEFAGSGPVNGPGSGVSDSIPARLSDGEFVFTAKAVEEIGEDSLMSMMKEAEAAADERQGLAMGGPTDEVEKPNTNVQGMLMSDATGVTKDLRERAISGDKRYIQS